MGAKKSRPYKKRRRLSGTETKLLMDSFDKNPKPNSKMRAKLAIQIPGMSERTIQIWFQNRRAKVKQLAKEETPSLQQQQPLTPSSSSLASSLSSSLKFTQFTPAQQQQQHTSSPQPSLSSPREMPTPNHAADYRQNYFQFSVAPIKSPRHNVPSPSPASPVPPLSNTSALTALPAAPGPSSSQGQLSNLSLPSSFTPLDLHGAQYPQFPLSPNSKGGAAGFPFTTAHQFTHPPPLMVFSEGRPLSPASFSPRGPLPFPAAGPAQTSVAPLQKDHLMDTAEPLNTSPTQMPPQQQQQSGKSMSIKFMIE